MLKENRPNATSLISDIKTAAIEFHNRSSEQCQAMTPRQRIYRRLANTATITGSAVSLSNSILVEPRCRDSQSSVKRLTPTFLRIASLGCDKLDGGLARKGNAQTDAGGTLDQNMDWINNGVDEIAAAYRGELSWAHVIPRSIRYVGIAGLRLVINAKSHGQVKTSSNKWGKRSTFIRDTANVVNGIPTDILPQPFNKIEKIKKPLQAVATIACVATGIYNAIDTLKRYTAWRSEQIETKNPSHG